MSTGLFGSQVTQLRQAYGFSRMAFADLLGVHPNTIANWETATEMPSKRLEVHDRMLAVMAEAIQADPGIAAEVRRAAKTDPLDAIYLCMQATR